MPRLPAALCAALLALAAPAAAQEAAAPAEAELWPRSTPNPPLPSDEARIDGLLSRMSLSAKVGQILMGEIQAVTPEDLRRYRLGALLNGGGSWPGLDKAATPADWLALADRYYQASMDAAGEGPAVPVLWGTDAVHGHNNVRGATLFPHNIALGAANNPDLVRQIGRATAREVVATGIDWTFAPTLAVPQDDRWGRTYEGFSESPDIVARLGEAAVLGLQGAPGGDFLGAGRVLATAKHFIGDGGTANGKDQGDNLADEAELARLHGAGYRSTLRAGVQTVMASFNSWQGRKLHGHHALLTVALKQRMGFDGMVLGDWNGHEQLKVCSVDDCPAALLAGVDMFMAPHDWKALHQSTLRHVKAGRIPMARLDDAVRRVLRVKLRAGLLDAKRPSERPLAGQSGLIGHPEHRALARRAVRESLVLLKNEGGVLPLSPRQRVLVMGQAADRIAVQAGGWSVTWQGDQTDNADFPGATSIWRGIQQAVTAGGGSAEFHGGGAAPLPPADVAILVFGEPPYAEFEGDRGDLDFEVQGGAWYLRAARALHRRGIPVPVPGGDGHLEWHLRAAHTLHERGVPVVSVFLSGRPLHIGEELAHSDALVAAWLPGSEGGGVADLLFAGGDGKPRYDFKGRLPFSWPQDATQPPQNPQTSPYTPRFPLGYGLSYTPPATGP